MRPALVIGGTGMLAGVVRHLTAHGRTTAVLARDHRTLTALAESCTGPGRVVPVAADYTSGARELRDALRGAARPTGPFGLAVLWVRTPHRPDVHRAVAGVLAADARVVEVVGSAAADPAGPAPETPEPFRNRPYRRVVLGFTDRDRSGPGAGSGAGGTRWLTHREICEGVLAALRGPEGPCTAGRKPDAPCAGHEPFGSCETYLVGRVRPWSDRPG
ncbi:hypothetical protein ACFYVL_04375 [Streptomyces sp. NPDC004111]|uniref:hypothetical protein n=1 Tax=Streptomyces sp. NPDC004111 TaxID=3364690 RepID=UPI003675A060